MPTDHPDVPGRRGRPPATASTGTSSIGGTRSPDCLPPGARPHHAGTTAAWSAPSEGLEKALSEIPALHEEFRKDLRVTGSARPLNQTLEKAGRVDDFFELAQLMCLDALTREESCGGHFRAEHQTDEGEAERDDENFAYVAAWEWTGDAGNPDPPRGTPRVRERPPRRPELQVAVT